MINHPHDEYAVGNQHIIWPVDNYQDAIKACRKDPTLNPYRRRVSEWRMTS